MEEVQEKRGNGISLFQGKGSMGTEGDQAGQLRKDIGKQLVPTVRS